MRHVAALLLIMFSAGVLLHAQENPSVEKLVRWIEPQADEFAWGRIPWLETFGEGIVAADKEQKPLLLWVMNGHPLGCT